MSYLKKIQLETSTENKNNCLLHPYLLIVSNTHRDILRHVLELVILLLSQKIQYETSRERKINLLLHFHLFFQKNTSSGI